jgi:hypothetical protein
MPIPQSSAQTCDRSARDSLALGLIGAILTGCVLYAIAASPHFDFLIRDDEFHLVLGTALIIACLSLMDLKAGLYALRHLNEPHGRSAKPLAVAGLALGLADLLPAVIILAIMTVTFLLQII